VPVNFVTQTAQCKVSREMLPPVGTFYFDYFAVQKRIDAKGYGDSKAESAIFEACAVRKIA